MVCSERKDTPEPSCERTFDYAIKARLSATRFWRINNREKRERNEYSPSEGDISNAAVEGDISNAAVEDNAPPIQDFTEKPVFMGGDAVALYPSMDIVGTTELVAKAVLESKVEFRNIDLKFLLVYLYLILGEEELKINGLGDFIPKRVKWKDSRARSLSAQINRCMNNWQVNTEEISWQEERMMIALMVKIAVLARDERESRWSLGINIFGPVSTGLGLDIQQISQSR